MLTRLTGFIFPSYSLCLYWFKSNIILLAALDWLQFYISTCSCYGLGWPCKEKKPGLVCWGHWGHEAEIRNFCLLFYVLKQHLQLTKFSSWTEVMKLLDGATWSSGWHPCPWVATRWSLRFLPTQSFLSFYDSIWVEQSCYYMGKYLGLLSQWNNREGGEQLLYFTLPSVWPKSLRFLPKETGCWVLLGLGSGLGSGLSPSSKAEHRGVVVRGSFQTLLMGRANPARSICNWKHNSHHSMFFTRAVSLHHCRVQRHRGTSFLFFFLIFPVSSSWVILGQVCPICETSKAHGCAEVPQKVLTLRGFHGCCILSLAIDNVKWWLCFHQVWLELALDSCW